jgi:hypothetical protein
MGSCRTSRSTRRSQIQRLSSRVRHSSRSSQAKRSSVSPEGPLMGKGQYPAIPVPPGMFPDARCALGPVVRRLPNAVGGHSEDVEDEAPAWLQYGMHCGESLPACFVGFQVVKRAERACDQAHSLRHGRPSKVPEPKVDEVADTASSARRLQLILGRWTRGIGRVQGPPDRGNCGPRATTGGDHRVPRRRRRPLPDRGRAAKGAAAAARPRLPGRCAPNQCRAAPTKRLGQYAARPAPLRPPRVENVML